MRKIFIIITFIALFILAGFGVYYYHCYKTEQPSALAYPVLATMTCTAESDFGILPNLYKPLNTLLVSISENHLLDSLYRTTDCIIELYYNTGNNKIAPVLWFVKPNLAQRFSIEFPQNLATGQSVFEINDSVGNKLYYCNTIKYTALSLSAEVLANIPTSYLPEIEDNTFSQNPNTFSINISDRIFQALDDIRELLPPFTSFYIPIDSLNGFVNTFDNKMLIRFNSIYNIEHTNIWSKNQPSNTDFVKYIPQGVIYFEAYSFNNYYDIFNKMQYIPQKRAELEQFSSQYQTSQADTMAALIENWIWSATIDFIETGDCEPIAGICISDTVKNNTLLKATSVEVKGEQLVDQSTKKKIAIRRLVTDNYFRYIFPSISVNTDTVFLLTYSKHIWIASSIKALRYAWGAYESNYTLKDTVTLNSNSYYYYRNIKKSRAAVSSTDNSPQARFLRSVFQNKKQPEHMLFQAYFPISPCSGTFYVW